MFPQTVMSGEHRAPWGCIYAKEDKSRCRPGKKPESDQEYFEILCLCILQAGLNWGTLRENWQKYRTGFHDFDINKLVKTQTPEIMRNPNAIRNSRKVEGILYNAKEFQRIREEHGSFSSFLASLRRIKGGDAPKLLRKRFRHVGPYTAEYYLHCVGY